MNQENITDVRGKDMGAMVGPDEDVVLDTSKAVLLDGIEVCLVGPPRDAVGPEVMLAMRLDGRINKTDDRAHILYILNEDGAAAIITELLNLSVRIGPQFAQSLLERLNTNGE
jgi:hypothetical protein